MTEVDTIGDALPREIARVTEILGHYDAIGPAGVFGATLIRYDLSHATKSLASGDVAEMIVAYNVLKDIRK